MRVWTLLLTFAAAALAQAPAVLRGTLLECEDGQFSVRGAGNQVFRFAFDQGTWIERDQRRVEARSLVQGDSVEVVSEQASGATLGYARTVHVLRPGKAPPPGARQIHWPLYPSLTLAESIAPRGNLTFAGVVARVNAERLVLRLRDAKEVSILLREDTKFLAAGDVADLAGLKPNARVFVRAGTSLYNEVEAYQVVWGEILEPRR